MGTANNSNNVGRNLKANNSTSNSGGGHNNRQNNNKKGHGKGTGNNNTRGKGFNGIITESVMRNIVLATDKGIPVAGQSKKFTKCVKAYADEKGVSYIVTCIKDLTDKDYDDFKPEEIDLSNCETYINTCKTDTKGKLLLDNDWNPVVEQVMVVTNAAAYEVAKELQKHKTRKKEDERQKFIDDKKLLLCLLLRQVNPTIKQQLNSLPEYEQIKKDCDLIGMMNASKIYVKKIRIVEQHSSHIQILNYGRNIQTSP